MGCIMKDNLSKRSISRTKTHEDKSSCSFNDWNLTGDFEIKKGYTVVGIASIFLVNLGNFKDYIR